MGSGLLILIMSHHGLTQLMQLPIQNQEIIEVKYGNQLILCFPDAELCIHADVVFQQNDAAECVLKMGMMQAGSCLIALMGQRVVQTHSDANDGALALCFSSGDALLVPAGPHENWHYRRYDLALSIYGGLFRVAVEDRRGG